MDKSQTKFLEALADTVKSDVESNVEAQSRRVWLTNLGLITASGFALWNCGKKSSNSADAGTTVTADPATDAAQYAAALALEGNAIQTYMAAAGLSNIATASAANGNGAVLAIAGGFLGHHQAHYAALSAAINAIIAANPTAGISAPAAAPTTAATLDDATKALLTDATYGVVNVLRLAAEKELAAAQAYISLIPNFTMISNATLHGLIGADEAAHYGVLRAALLAVIADKRDTSLTGATVVSASTIDKATATGPA